MRGVKEVLTLKEDRSIDWSEDPRWELDMKMAALLPGEEVFSASSKSSCVVN